MVADLTKTTAHPLGVSLFTDETQTQYKDVYQYLKDIAEIWDDFDKEGRAQQKQTLMEKLFGKNRANVYPHVQKCAWSKYLIAGNTLEPYTTIEAKALYDGLKT